MNKSDLLKVYAFAGAIWTSFKTPTGELEARLFDEVWFGILKPYPVELILTAIQQYATENDFCNVAKIGDICKKYTEKANGTYIEPEQVLSEIRKAIDYYHCKENFEKLSPFAKQIVESPAFLARWARSEQIDTVIMSNLRKKINNALEEKKHNEILEITTGNKKLLQ